MRWKTDRYTTPGGTALRLVSALSPLLLLQLLLLLLLLLLAVQAREVHASWSNCSSS